LNRNYILKLLLVILSGIFIAGFSIVPLTGSPYLAVTYPVLKVFYSKVCHQIPYKCFEINGFHFLVCARCTGIYAGAFISSLVYLFIKKQKLKVDLRFLLFLVPMILDIILYRLGIYNYSKTLAFFTGLPAGFMVVSIIISIFAIEFFDDFRKNDL
jgi:uncharacterized membrane protein